VALRETATHLPPSEIVTVQKGDQETGEVFDCRVPLENGILLCGPSDTARAKANLFYKWRGKEVGKGRGGLGFNIRGSRFTECPLLKEKTGGDV